MVNQTAFLRAAQNHKQATKILQRTFEVKTVKKTRSLVKKWTKYEVPIAVDIESHNNEPKAEMIYQRPRNQSLLQKDFAFNNE